MLSALASCWDKVAQKTYLRNETERGKRLKHDLLPIYTLACVLYGCFLPETHTVENLDDLGGVIGSCTAVILPASLFLSGERLTEVGVLIHALVMLLRDVGLAAQVRARCWSMVVIVVDVTLVAETRQSIVTAIVCGVVFCIWFVVSEQVFGYGLFDVANFGANPEVEVCDCTNPPCAREPVDAMADGIAISMVFLLDYYVTRRFAVSMREQMSQISASVETCDLLIRLLARYEVEAATEQLDGSSGEQLPPALRQSYRRLLANLESYKPYLPDSLLLADDDERMCDESSQVSCGQVPAPGAGLAEADVCIVFTDVQGSTSLWEEFPRGMYTGLQQHNTVLRRAAALLSGYEVKTIGDAFMLAFHDVCSGVEFAVAAQRQLAAAEWPSDLLQSPLCQRVASSDGEVLWKGLRVRIGVHFGGVRVERNPVTGRCDYFGPPVNIAARIESEIRYGGLVGISDKVLEMLGTDGIEGLAAVARPLGARKLKGVAAPTLLHIVLPVEMQERSDVLESKGSAACELQRNNSIPLHRVLTSDTRHSVLTESDPGDLGLRAPTNNNSRLSLQMRKSIASCAAVTITLRAGDVQVSQLVTAVERAADVSQGVLQSVLSATCVVTWNAPRACAGHAAQCGYFLSEVERHCDSTRVCSYAGAASGAAMSGNLAGRRKRFATVVAGCVELAGALAVAAQLREIRALVVGLVAGHCKTHGVGFVRTGGGVLAVGEVVRSGDDRVRVQTSASEDFPTLPPLWGVDMVGSVDVEKSEQVHVM